MCRLFTRLFSHPRKRKELGYEATLEPAHRLEGCPTLPVSVRPHPRPHPGSWVTPFQASPGRGLNVPGLRNHTVSAQCIHGGVLGNEPPWRRPGEGESDQTQVAPASCADLTESLVAHMLTTGDCACARAMILIGGCAQVCACSCSSLALCLCRHGRSARHAPCD